MILFKKTFSAHLFAVWSFLSWLACVLFYQGWALQDLRQLPHNWPAGTLFLSMFPPFGYVAIPMSQAGLSAWDEAPIAIRRIVRRRIWTVAKTFPFSSAATIAYLAYAVWVTLGHTHSMQGVFAAGISIFSAVALFICSRLCLTQKGLQLMGTFANDHM